MAAALNSSHAATRFSRAVKSSMITTDIFAPPVVTTTSDGRDSAGPGSAGSGVPMTSLLLSGPSVEPALFAWRVKIVFIILSFSIRPPLLLRERAATEQFAIQQFQQRNRRNHPVSPEFPRADYDVQDRSPRRPEPVEHEAE